MQLLFAIRQGFQVNWAYLIIEHMDIHSKNTIEILYAFFLSKIFVYYGVNFTNEDRLKWVTFFIFVKMHNNKMGVKYNHKTKTIRYIDEFVNVQATPPPSVQQPISQKEPTSQQIFDYMTYMNTFMNNQFAYLYSQMNISPYQVQIYQFHHYQTHEIPTTTWTYLVLFLCFCCMFFSVFIM